MNLGAASIITVLRPVSLDGMNPEHLFSESAVAIWRNCTFVSELAQKTCDPHGKDRHAKMCREIVKHCADCKLNLTKLTSTYVTEAQAAKLTARIVKDYEQVKNLAGKVFPEVNPFWGRTIPQLL